MTKQTHSAKFLEPPDEALSRGQRPRRRDGPQSSPPAALALWWWRLRRLAPVRPTEDDDRAVVGETVPADVAADGADARIHHGVRPLAAMLARHLEEALNAATQIGDDTLQRRSRGTVVPETFTHGTGAQRVAWFKRGLQSGSVNQCDTFATREL